MSGVIAVCASAVTLAACRKDAPRTDEGDAASPMTGSAAAAEDAGTTASAGGDEGVADAAGQAALGVEARAENIRRDAGAVDAACEGTALSLLAAAVDPRCAVTEREWADLVRSFEAALGGPHGEGSLSKGKSGPAASSRSDANGDLRQEARREGNDIVVSIVNRGSRPLVVPLRFHPGHPELAFSILAESAGRGVFELAPPKTDAPTKEPASTTKPSALDPRHPARPFTLAEVDAGPSYERVYSAQIRLAPGGAARARLVVDPRIVKRLDKPCPEAGAPGPGASDGTATECQPSRLPKGRVVLYVGQLVAGIDAGDPARVEWDSP